MSRFTHLKKINRNTYALWNSLWLRTVFLDEKNIQYVKILRGGLDDSDNRIKDNEISHLLTILKENNYFESDKDTRKLQEIRSLLANQNISILYLVLSEECNLRCDYCFLKELIQKANGASRKMRFSVAKKAINEFATIIREQQISNPHVIFYGGEPMLNWRVLIESLKLASSIIPNCKFSLNTNGTIMNSDIANFLKKFNVSVGLSIDGKEHDFYRKTKTGDGTLNSVLSTLRILKDFNVNVGASYVRRQNIWDKKVFLLRDTFPIDS